MSLFYFLFNLFIQCFAGWVVAWFVSILLFFVGWFFQILFSLKLRNLIFFHHPGLDPVTFLGFSHFWLLILDLWANWDGWRSTGTNIQNWIMTMWCCAAMYAAATAVLHLIYIYAYKCGNMLRCFSLLIRNHFNGGWTENICMQQQQQ